MRRVDLAVDGADTVDPDLRLLKGLGGALVRERIVAAAASRFVIVADETKLRPRLAGFVPVELLVFGWHHTMTLLSQTGAGFSLRLDAAGEPLRSDNGNLVADGEFAPIADPEGWRRAWTPSPASSDMGCSWAWPTWSSSPVRTVP